ncbi:NADPH-dependent FMN reductase [Stappia sp.]|uniref:NADPH-dependent FMN reductase n=1 Tax=Stappia sp. TaxID=1870903 RepID=UPI0025F1EDF9|nr:NADPH-dependent FMN reductase [Stappia sp.]
MTHRDEIFLAVSGSARQASTNTALLNAIADAAPSGCRVEVYDRLAGLPVFSPDAEEYPLPAPVADFVARVERCDGLIISSPEYVRALPGGLKNAIDWLVSRDEIVFKPVVLVHASHRGNDMLEQLRLVLSTVTRNFHPELFLRFDLMKRTPREIGEVLAEPEKRRAVEDFLQAFARFCKACRTEVSER